MKSAHYFLILIACACTLSSMANGQNGLVAEYYDGKNFDTKVATLIEYKIDHYWDRIAPVEGMDPNVCSVRWTGKLEAPENGTYEFSAKVDDGIRVWVGEQLLIDDWQLNDMGVFEGEVYMEAGKQYDLRVDYFNAMNEAEITLFWEIPDKNKSWFSRWFKEDKKVIDPKYFYQPEEIPALALTAPPVPEILEDPVVKEPVPQPKKKVVKKVERPVETKVAKVEKHEELNLELFKKYTPKNIGFDRAKSEILAESFLELDKLSQFLKRNPTLHIKIEGHTDDVGNKAKNLELSKRRANAVAAYLVKDKIVSTRITAEGYGGTRPLVKSSNGKYHPQNRRVEFIITDTALANQ